MLSIAIPYVPNGVLSPPPKFRESKPNEKIPPLGWMKLEVTPVSVPEIENANGVWDPPGDPPVLRSPYFGAGSLVSDKSNRTSTVVALIWVRVIFPTLPGCRPTLVLKLMETANEEAAVKRRLPMAIGRLFVSREDCFIFIRK